MQLPSEEKRKTHCFYFVDLGRSLTREEILKEYKSQLVDKQQLPLRTIIDEMKHRAKGWIIIRM